MYSCISRLFKCILQVSPVLHAKSCCFVGASRYRSVHGEASGWVNTHVLAHVIAALRSLPVGRGTVVRGVYRQEERPRAHSRLCMHKFVCRMPNCHVRNRGAQAHEPNIIPRISGVLPSAISVVSGSQPAYILARGRGSQPAYILARGRCGGSPCAMACTNLSSPPASIGRMRCSAIATTQPAQQQEDHPPG